MMTIKELSKRYPDHFIFDAKFWTPKRNTIETRGSCDPIVGELVNILLARSNLHGAELRAAKNLLDTLKLDGKGDVDGDE